MMDGACDVSCKNQYDREPYENMLALRARCVEEGELLPVHMLLIDNLKKEDNMMLAKKADRGNWADGLNVKDVSKETSEVLFHAGCRFSYDEDLWPIVRGGVSLLQKAGVDLGIMGSDETCCGGRAYEMGYQGELTKFAEHNTQNWKRAGIKTIITACSDCYQAFKVLYDKVRLLEDVEILHITEYLFRLIEEGKLTFTKEVPMTVTYHDPCHLGRLSEPWIHWNGVETKLKDGLTGLVIQEPQKKFRRGADGVYDVPRKIIRSIPGVRLVEMERIREYAWCCGAGGGVLEAYPDFAQWTADERIKEAQASGAKAMVTACGWCERNFRDVIDPNDLSIEIYDIVELLEMAV
jgi:Fe-S oxidoreductase